MSFEQAITPAAARTGGNTTWWCVLIALCLVLLAPLTLTDVPPLLDYPNHLARLYVLAFVAHDPVLARFYVPRWGIIPNLGLDLTVPPLLRIFPVHLVGRAVIATALLLPVFGAVAYHRALSGRLSYWPLCSVLFAYNAALLRGFLNFIISVGLALLLGAAWVAWRERRPSLAIITSAVGAVALFFCHLTGLLFFAILLGGHELAMLRTQSRPARWALRRLAVIIVIFATPAALYALSDLQNMRGESVFRSVADKANAALMPVMNYLWPLDLATAGFCIAVPTICLVRRWCRMPLQAVAAFVVVIGLFIGLPTAFKGTFDLDTRFIVMAAFVASAGLLPAAIPRRAASAFAIGFLILFGARMAVLAAVWNDRAIHVAAFRSVVATVQPGDVVMTVRRRRARQTDLWTEIATARHLSDGTIIDAHLPALLVIEHRAWWPFLFANQSQQPIASREPYRSLGNLIDSAPDPIALLTHDAPEMRPVTHVLVLGPPPSADEIAKAGLRLIAGNSEASLFAVMRDEISQPRPPSPPSGR